MHDRPCPVSMINVCKLPSSFVNPLATSSSSAAFWLTLSRLEVNHTTNQNHTHRSCITKTTSNSASTHRLENREMTVNCWVDCEYFMSMYLLNETKLMRDSITVEKVFYSHSHWTHPALYSTMDPLLRQSHHSMQGNTPWWSTRLLKWAKCIRLDI